MRVRCFSALVALCAIGFLTSCSKNEGSFPVRMYPLGQKVALGNLNYMGYESQWLTQLGEGVDARVPQQRFFLVRVSVVNSGPSDTMVPAFSLMDDKGEMYQELTNGDKVDSWIGALRPVKPADTLQGSILFDVKPAHYKLKITDETEQRTAFIDIPLSFGSESPDLPLPETPEKPKKQ